MSTLEDGLFEIVQSKKQTKRKRVKKGDSCDTIK